MIVCLGDGVLCSKPQILLDAERIIEACSCKSTNGLVCVVHTLENARIRVFENSPALLPSVGISNHKLGSCRAFHSYLCVLINIAVCVTSDGNRLLPAGNERLDAVNEDRSSEYGTVEHCPDGSVGALPHLCQVVLRHSLSIGSNGGALNGNTEFLGLLSSIDSNLILGGFTVLESEIKILRLKMNIGIDNDILDLLPDYPGHLIAVHLDERCLHCNLSHALFSPLLE